MMIRKRRSKRSKGNPSGSGKKNKKQVEFFDDTVESSDDEDDLGSNKREKQGEEVSGEDLIESVESKKIRLAREYLSKVEAQSDSDSSSDDDVSGDEASGPDRLSQKLARQRLKSLGHLERVVAEQVKRHVETLSLKVAKQKCEATTLEEIGTPEEQAKAWHNFRQEDDNQQTLISFWKGHDMTVTCVDLDSTHGTTAYSGSKDNSVLCWDVERESCKATIIPQWRKLHFKEHHIGFGEVLALAASDDGRYLATGGRDSLVRIFDLRIAGKSDGSRVDTNTEQGAPVATFRGHKGAVTALTFRSQSLQLFSGGEDGIIRYYSLEEMLYMDALYGHQSGITSLDCFQKERPVSTGRDRTARLWKLAEETHIIFRGGSQTSAADCMSVIKEDWFLTGHDDGYLSLWFAGKKKAIRTIRATFDPSDNNKSPMISSCDALKGSDLAATGSNDGFLRLWNVSTGNNNEERALEPLTKIPIHGFINGIRIGPKGTFCILGTGQEHRLGRWEKVPRAKNRVALVKLQDDCYDNAKFES